MSMPTGKKSPPRKVADDAQLIKKNIYLNRVAKVVKVLPLFWFAAVMVVLLWALFFAYPTEETVAPPGDAARFDPLAHYAEIAAFAGDGFHLTSLHARGVRRDGTIDLNRPRYEGSVGVEGFREVPAPADAPPVGAGGSLDGRYWETVRVDLYEPGQWRTVRGGGRSSSSWRHLGMAREPMVQPTRPTQKALDAPTCATKALFDALVAKGAPESAVAILRYGEGGFELSVQDTPFEARFSPTCQLLGD
jgi:hypothetical protein